MAPGPPPFIDLHLHAEGVSDADLTTLSWFGLRAAVTCAHDAGASTADELRRHWDELVTVQVRRLEGAGIRPWVALAVHPARIPWHGVDDLLHRLPRYFDDPRVVALGELGLQHGGEREEELLARQLQLSIILRKPVIVHTPAEAKAAVIELRKLMPNYTVDRWIHAGFSDNPAFLSQYQRIVEGLRKAGLPE